MNIIKKLVNSNTVTRAAKDSIKLAPAFGYDKKIYRTAKAEHGSNDYKAIMISHSLEKGMSFDTPRPFGKEKVKELMQLCPGIKKENKSALEISINALREYASFYEKQKWTTADEYLEVKEFLNKYKSIPRHKAGTELLSKQEIMKNASIDYEKFLLSRHSIRDFSDKELKMSDIEKAINIARLTPTACNRQMIKVVLCQSDKAKNEVLSAIKGNLIGFNTKNITPIVVTFDAAAFNGPTERNQGWLNAGLFTMNLVNALHSIGVATCMCEFQQPVSTEKKLKESLRIPKNERIAVTIMAGYYLDTNKVYISQRVSPEEILRVA